MTNQELKDIIIRQEIQIKEIDKLMDELQDQYSDAMDANQELRFELFDAEELVQEFKNELIGIFGITKYYELLN